MAETNDRNIKQEVNKHKTVNEQIQMMPKKYVRRTTRADRGTWTEDVLKDALSAIESGAMGVNQAAKHYGIPGRTLRRHKKRGQYRKLSLGFPGVFSPQNEQLFVRHIQRLLNERFPVNRQAVRSMAYRFAEDLNLSHRFNRTTKTAGFDWLNTFLKRNKDIHLMSGSLQEPLPEILFDFKKTETEGTAGKQSLEVLSRLFQQHDLACHPEKIFIFSQLQIAQPEDDFTILACYNASGQFLPPVIIFQGVKLMKEMYEEIPQGGDIFVNNESSSLNSQLLQEWLQTFFVPSKPQGKVLLIFEGYPAYLDCRDLIQLAETSDTVLLNLQILSTKFLKPFKDAYEQERTSWMESGKVISRVRICSIFKNAWMKVAKTDVALREFREFGIFPLEGSLLPDRCFEIFNRNVLGEKRERSDDSSIEAIEIEDSDEKEEPEETIVKVEIEDVQDLVEVKQEPEDPATDEQIRNNCSMFATEPIFESVLMKHDELKNEALEPLTELEEVDDYESDDEFVVASRLYLEPSFYGDRDVSDEICQTPLIWDYPSNKVPSRNLKTKQTQTFNTPTQSYKKCYIPGCNNTSHDITKVFVKVQLNNIVYKRWAQKFGPEVFQSPYVLCGNHFDLAKDTWTDESHGKLNVHLKANALPVRRTSRTEPTKILRASTKFGPIICVRPKVKVVIERDESVKVKSEMYRVMNTPVRDATVECRFEKKGIDQSTQIDITTDSVMKLFYCSLPGCSSTNADTPKKLFFSVPEDERLMTMWSRSLGVGTHRWMMSHSPSVHCCEDHFNELDKVDDWERYKQGGCKVTVDLNQRRTKSRSKVTKRMKTS